MNNAIWFLVFGVVLALVGIGFQLVRHHQPRRYDQSIVEFEQTMSKLEPRVRPVGQSSVEPRSRRHVRRLRVDESGDTAQNAAVNPASSAPPNPSPNASNT